MDERTGGRLLIVPDGPRHFHVRAAHGCWLRMLLALDIPLARPELFETKAVPIVIRYRLERTGWANSRLDARVVGDDREKWNSAPGARVGSYDFHIGAPVDAMRARGRLSLELTFSVETRGAQSKATLAVEEIAIGGAAQ